MPEYASIVELTGLTFGTNVTGPPHEAPPGYEIVWRDGVYPAMGGSAGTIPYTGGQALEHEQEWDTDVPNAFSQQAEYEGSDTQVWHYPSGVGRTYLPGELWNHRFEHLRAFDGYVRHTYDGSESNAWSEGVTSFGEAPTRVEYESGMVDLDTTIPQDQIVTDAVYTRQTSGWNGISKTPTNTKNLLNSRMVTHVNRGSTEFQAATDPPDGGSVYGIVRRPHPDYFGSTSMNDVDVFGTEGWQVKWQSYMTGSATSETLTVGYIEDPNTGPTGYPRTRPFATPTSLRDTFTVTVPDSDTGVEVIKDLSIRDYVRLDGTYTFLVTLWWKPDWNDIHVPQFGAAAFVHTATVSLSSVSGFERSTTWTMVYPALQYGYLIKTKRLSIPRRQTGRTDGLLGAGRQRQLGIRQTARVL